MDRRCSYNFEDVGDDAIGRDMAVSFEEVSLGRSERLEVRIEPPDVLVTASDPKS